MKPETVLIREKIDFKDAKPVSTPIFQTSAFRSGDQYFYSRKSNPNFVEVERVLASLDNGVRALLYSSGMAAISAVLHLLAPGDRLVVNELIYGCSYRFIADYCSQFDIHITFCDLTDPAVVRTLIGSDTSMVFFETPTNPFLKTVDIRDVVDRVRSVAPDAIVVVDNTWATSLYQKPLIHGADVALYSNSKFFSGHGDIITGTIVARTEHLAARLELWRFYSGTQPDPFAAWLLRRSLQTLAVRMDRHVKTTATVAAHLRKHPLVEEVYLPAVDSEQLTQYGGLLFVRFSFRSAEASSKFVQSLTLFDQGTSMASVASAVAIPYFGSHLSMSPEEKARIGLDPSLIRLSLGLEDPIDLIEDIDNSIRLAADLERAFEHAS